MFRNIFKKSNKQLLLGRWKTNNNLIDINRKIDLANCDSCGTCNVPDYKQSVEKMIVVDDDIVDINIPLQSFSLNGKR